MALNAGGVSNEFALRGGIAVVGAGITGVCAAWIAASRGVPVAVFDKRPEPGGGTTFSSGGSIGLQDKTSEASIEMALEAIEFYKGLQGHPSELLRDLIVWCGGLVPYWSDADGEQMLAIADRLRRAGVAVEQVQASMARSIVPSLAPGIAGGFYCPAEGRLAPTGVARAMMQLLARTGAEVTWHPRTTVSSIEPGTDGYTLAVMSDGRRHTLDCHGVVIATGAEFAQGKWPMERDIVPRRGLILTFDALEEIQVVMHGSSYAAAKDSDDARLRVAFAFEPRDGMWRVGASRELVGRSAENLEGVIAKIRVEAKRYLPALERGELRAVHVCFRPFESGTTGYVRAGNACYHRVVAITGQEGEGITLAPALARKALDLVIGDRAKMTTHAANG